MIVPKINTYFRVIADTLLKVCRIDDGEEGEGMSLYKGDVFMFAGTGWAWKSSKSNNVSEIRWCESVPCTCYAYSDSCKRECTFIVPYALLKEYLEMGIIEICKKKGNKQ